MNMVVRCLFRWILGLVLGLVPALGYYLYAQANQVFHDDMYYSRLTGSLEIGVAAGAIWGAIWAARLVIVVYSESGSRGRMGGP